MVDVEQLNVNNIIEKGIFSQNLEQFEQIFRRCQQANLQLNDEKTHFGFSDIDYLGYIVTPEGVKPDPKKIKAIQATSRPSIY